MGYEYRVFIDSPEGDTDATHYSDEKLYEGAIFRLNKPGTKSMGSRSSSTVDSHPGFKSLGIAWARTEGG
jgi:hypothetical protein